MIIFQDKTKPLYETTLSWNNEPQNIEKEISNDEVWNRSRSAGACAACRSDYFRLI